MGLRDKIWSFYILTYTIVSSAITGTNHNNEIAASADVPVTVTIVRIIQVEDPDPTPFEGDGDYFVKVNMNNQVSVPSHLGTTEGSDFLAFWTFTQYIDPNSSNLTAIPIVLELWDDDDFTDDKSTDL